MEVVVFGIPNCDTVKKARTWLDQQGVSYRFHDFRRDGIDAARLTDWLRQTPLDTLLNRRGTTWRGLSDAARACAVDEAAAIALMASHPSLIKRPVLVVDAQVAAVGFAADTWRGLAL
ncbi:MAG: ArsC family reductase [Janthinobacterium lividum]